MANNPIAALNYLLASQQRERSDLRNIALKRLGLEMADKQNKIEQAFKLKTSKEGQLTSLISDREKLLDKVNELNIVTQDVLKVKKKDDFGGDSMKLVGGVLNNLASEVKSIDQNISDTRNQIDQLEALRSDYNYGYGKALGMFTDIVNAEKGGNKYLLESSEIKMAMDKLKGEFSEELTGMNTDAVMKGLQDALLERESTVSDIGFKQAQAQKMRSGSGIERLSKKAENRIARIKAKQNILDDKLRYGMDLSEEEVELQRLNNELSDKLSSHQRVSDDDWQSWVDASELITPAEPRSMQQFILKALLDSGGFQNENDINKDKAQKVDAFIKESVAAGNMTEEEAKDPENIKLIYDSME